MVGIARHSHFKYGKMIVILTMMLVVGGIFILLPLKLFRQKEDSFLRIDESQSTKDIQAIIMFVGTLNIKKGLGIETLLPYKVLMQMSKVRVVLKSSFGFCMALSIKNLALHMEMPVNWHSNSVQSK